jgi:hypothetical protein
VLIGGIVAVVVVAGLAAAVLLRRRSHDDVHSVEHYHKQLHTLQGIRDHPAGSAGVTANGHAAPAEAEAEAPAAFPASAFRVSSSSTVRLTDLDRPPVPPVPPPPVPNSSELVTFDDGSTSEERPGKNFMRDDDRALHSIDRRPRKLGAPLVAVGAVLLLIAILIVTGVHSDTPSSHHGSRGATKDATATTVPHAARGTTHKPAHHAVATTTVAPAVSAPAATSTHGATYQVTSDSYSLVLSASNGECWVDVVTTTGTTLFTGTLFTGQSHTIAATGPVKVVAGAPAAFAATVNGVALSLPFGYQAPFTLTFDTPGSPAAVTTSSTSG